MGYTPNIHHHRHYLQQGLKQQTLSASRSPASDTSPEACECDACPEYPAGRVSLVVAQVATCPEYPSRESFSGCRPSRHVSRVPEPIDPLGYFSECATLPGIFFSECAMPREPIEITPGTRRARHVSPGVFFFSRILKKKYTENSQNFRNAQ